MVAAVLLFQLAATAPTGLETARALLEASDTTAAARELSRIATEERLSPGTLASIFLLGWIARGATDDPVVREWDKLRESGIRLWRDIRRGRLLFGGPVELAVGDVLSVWEQIVQGKSDSLISWSVGSSVQPKDWRVTLDTLAASMDRQSALLAGAIRWLRVADALHALDTIAADAPVVPSCEPDCFRLEIPPPEFRLLVRFQESGQDTLLETLGRLFADLERAPWPFNALGARAHVAVCALTRLGEGVAGCWPDGAALGGREAAEVQAMVRVFRGQPRQAWSVMEEAPGWFLPLDSLRDLVDPPGRLIRPAGPYRYAPSYPAPADDRRMPVDLLWKAAWPLYLLPYNERRVVHRARLLLADVVWRLAGRNALGLFSPVGDAERLVAVGVPLGAAIAGRRRAILGYYPRGTHETAPRTARGGTAMPLDLMIVATGNRGSRVTGFASEQYDVFGPLDHQVVQYIRDGRRQVDVHTTWHRDPLCTRPRPLLGLFLLDERLRELRRTTLADLQPGRHIQLRLTLHPAIYVYSLELFDAGCRRAERARYVLTVTGVEGTMLSDLMLADELHYGDGYRGADRLRDRQPATIRPALEFQAGGTARFYWEIYGVTADTLTAGGVRVEFAIVNVREEKVAVRELGRVARDAAETRPTFDVSYLVNVPAGDGPLTSGLAVGLPPDARGVHIARLTVTDTRTGRTGQAQRAFFVRG